jgi:hypothetical protein
MTRKGEPYVKRSITLIGDTISNEPCEICQEADQYLTPLIERDKRIEYKKVEVSTPEGEKLADEKKVKSIPYFEDCKYYAGKDKPECRKISGWSAEDDWSDLNEIVEAEKDESVTTTEDKTE